MGTSGASGITSSVKSTTEEDCSNGPTPSLLLCRKNVKFAAVKCLRSGVKNLFGATVLGIESR